MTRYQLCECKDLTLAQKAYYVEQRKKGMKKIVKVSRR